MNYQEKLNILEAEIEVVEASITDLKTRLADLLRDRPCDFYLEREGKIWTKRTYQGHDSGFGWSEIDPYHQSVLVYQREKPAEHYAAYLTALKGIGGIEIKRRPINEQDS
jgi:hypothetical protein